MRRGGREFFVARDPLAARIPPQSPVTSRYRRAELVTRLMFFGAKQCWETGSRTGDVLRAVIELDAIGLVANYCVWKIV